MRSMTARDWKLVSKFWPGHNLEISEAALRELRSQLKQEIRDPRFAAKKDENILRLGQVEAELAERGPA
jgi:hypothetical protein